MCRAKYRWVLYNMENSAGNAAEARMSEPARRSIFLDALYVV